MKLRDYAAAIGFDVGCTDVACIWGAPDIGATSTRCQCVGLGYGDVSSVRLELRAMATVARALLADLMLLEPLVKAADAYAADQSAAPATDLLLAAVNRRGRTG